MLHLYILPLVDSAIKIMYWKIIFLTCWYLSLTCQAISWHTFELIARSHALLHYQHMLACPTDDVACQHMHELLLHTYTILADKSLCKQPAEKDLIIPYTLSDLFFFHQLMLCTKKHSYMTCYNDMILLLEACSTHIAKDIEHASYIKALPNDKNQA